MDDTDKPDPILKQVPLIKNPSYQPPKAVSLRTNYSKLLPALPRTVAPPNLNITKEDIDKWSRELNQFKDRIGNDRQSDTFVTSYEKWIKEQILHYRSRSSQQPKVKPNHKFDLVKNRNNFENPVLSQWTAPTKAQRVMTLPLKDRCDLYFNSAKDVEFDLNFWKSFKPDPRVYKRKKWIRDRTRSEKRKYKKTSEWKEEYDKEIAREFTSIAKEYSDLEKKMFNELGHMKIFGKCYGTEVNSSAKCEDLQSKLYPWLTNKPPLVTNADGEVKQNDFQGCITQSLIGNKGKGIVIPTQPKQVDNICRLLNSLIVLENKLPVEIAYLSLSEDEKSKIVNAARNSTTFVQQISFVDMTPSLQLGKFPFLKSDANELLLSTFSLIFNSFAEVVLLTGDAIPLNDLERLFQNPRYKSSGRFFFRSRPYLDREKFTPGFHEVASLVKHHLQPTIQERDFFNLQMPVSTIATARFFQHHSKNIIDPSLVLANKSSCLSGHLITINMHFYNILKLRLTHSSMYDLIWIGQGLSGQEVTFNNNYPVMAGIYTPEENIPRDAKQTYEICSSSMAQLSEANDVSLLYITSDQLQNWLRYTNSMTSVFEQKYVTKYTEMVANLFDANDPNKTEMVRVNYDQVTKLTRNPLLIEHIIKPPALTSIVYVHSFEEPNEAWVEEPKLVSERMRHDGKKIYCAYDTVGNPLEEGVRGLTINVDDESIAKYDKITRANHITLSETKPDSPLKHEPDTYNNSWNSELNVPQITTLSAPIQVLINRRADMFKGFYFLDQDFSIGPYSLVKMVKPQWYNIEVGLSTSYNTVFPESVLKKYASTGYSQNPPQNAYMLKSFAKQNLISSIVGWSPQEKLIAITFKCCHPLHCVVFDLVEAALAVESVSSALFRHLATEFNDAWERLEKLKQ
ncbi:unnamed protein product [Candida parapsilosis]